MFQSNIILAVKQLCPKKRTILSMPRQSQEKRVWVHQSGLIGNRFHPATGTIRSFTGFFWVCEPQRPSFLRHDCFQNGADTGNRQIPCWTHSVTKAPWVRSGNGSIAWTFIRFSRHSGAELPAFAAFHGTTAYRAMSDGQNINEQSATLWNDHRIARC
jgi:hypothetical protein